VQWAPAPGPYTFVMDPRKRRRPSRRAVVAWLVIVLAAYAGLMTFGGCADALLMHPSRYHVDARGATQRFIPFDDKRLEIWTARSPGVAAGREPEAFVVEFCGNATRAEQIARYVADRWGERPVEVWVMNYPGYGGSPGRARLATIAPAALSTYDEVDARATGRPIFVAGSSLGSVPALHVARHRAPAGVILHNPPPLRPLILGRYGWWNLWLVAGPVSLKVPRELDSPANAAACRAPAVIMLSGRDAVVPYTYQKRVADAYAGPKRVLTFEDADHNDAITGDADRQLQGAMDWLWEQRSPAPPSTQPEFAGPVASGTRSGRRASRARASGRSGRAIRGTASAIR
jgi:uncharacterized protein